MLIFDLEYSDLAYVIAVYTADVQYVGSALLDCFALLHLGA